MEMESILVGEADCEIFGGGGQWKIASEAQKKIFFPKII